MVCGRQFYDSSDIQKISENHKRRVTIHELQRLGLVVQNAGSPFDGMVTLRVPAIFENLENPWTAKSKVGSKSNRPGSAAEGASCAAPTQPVLVPALFPGNKATVLFGEPIEHLREAGLKECSKKQAPIALIEEKSTSAVRSVVKNAGMQRITCEDEGWKQSSLIWCSVPTVETFKSLLAGQRINHFPATWELGRKDKLAQNLSRMIRKHGRDHFNFYPLTFVLPHDASDWRRECQRCFNRHLYILKPYVRNLPSIRPFTFC